MNVLSFGENNFLIKLEHTRTHTLKKRSTNHLQQEKLLIIFNNAYSFFMFSE